MASTGKILDIARQALSAQQAALNTTGHNIANVNTPGYSRQRVIMEANKPTKTGWGFYGNGVSINTIERMRNSYLDSEIRNEKQEMGSWAYREMVYTELESVFNEPSDNSLGQNIRDFWDGWGTLANDPESASAREVVRQNGSTLASTFHNIYSRIQNLQQNMNQDMETLVVDVNSILHQIGDLNTKISSLESGSATANDYRDKRDLLFTQLSELVAVNGAEGKNGMLTITLGGKIMLERDSVNEIKADNKAAGDISVTVPVWSSDNRTVQVSSGRMKGLLDMRDGVIPDMLASLDELANTFVSQVNAVHETGYGADGNTGRSFFNINTTGAKDIALSNDVLESLSYIAASDDGQIGDGNNALTIARLSEEKVLSGNSATTEDYYAGLMGNLGVKSAEARSMTANQELLVEQIEVQQSSYSGVSLDEEMTNLIKYQHAYEAAARLVRSVDEMMQTVIEMV